jgi:PIN domain nuclease of toxin-antitoxin system
VDGSVVSFIYNQENERRDCVETVITSKFMSSWKMTSIMSSLDSILLSFMGRTNEDNNAFSITSIIYL